MNNILKYDYILDHKLTNKANLLEQLAEECAELTKAALKEARILRGESYHTKKEKDILANLTEECADVMVMLTAVIEHGELVDEFDIYHLEEVKLDRWIERLKKMEEGND